MKTIAAIVEDQMGNVIGAELVDGSKIALREEERIPRDQLAVAARRLAETYAVALPENPAIPPE